MTLKCCKHITKAGLGAVSAMLLALSMLTGCAASNPMAPDESAQPVVVAKETFVNLDLRISVNDGASSGSRAFNPDDDGDFEPTDINYEKVHTLRVVIVREDGTVEHNRMVTVRDNYGNTIMAGDIINDNLRFKVVAPEKKRIYLFANESAVNRNKTADEKFDFTSQLTVGSTFPTEAVSDILIERSANKAFIDNGPSTPLADKCYIPMSEFFDIDIPAFEDIQADIVMTPSGAAEKTIDEHLFITRSLIKFSFFVALAPGMDVQDTKMSLLGVKISNLANEGYYLPNNTMYRPEKYKDSERADGGREITSFSMPDEYGASDCTFLFNEPMPLTLDGGYSSPLIYLPESKVADGSYDLSLLFYDPEQDELYESKPLQIKDIPRNTHVKINIRLNTHTMDATVTLFPYTAVNLNPLFGFSVPVQSIHITEASSEVAVGQSVSLTAYVLPEDANNKNIIWSSANPDIATVSNEGLVTGVKEGTATITATSEGDTDIKTTCSVVVTPRIPVVSLDLNQSTWNGNIGETVNLLASVSPTYATNRNIIWTSSNTNVATVSAYGTVTAVNPGTTTITAASEDDPTKSVSCTVTVNPRVMVNSVTLSGTQPSPFYQQDQFSLTASVSPQNATNQTLTWTSSNTNVATVSSYGLVTAVNPGTATITATAKDGSGKSATRNVTVTAKRAVTGVTISRTTAETTVDADPKLTLTATISPTNPTYNKLTWTSSDPYVAVVSGSTTPNSSTGRATATITATYPGTTVITVASVDDPTKYATCTVTVK